jgi:hypothetical protein
VKTLANASLLLALSFGITACTPEQAGSGDDPGDEPGDGSDDDVGGDDLKGADAAGRYTMRSNFDLATNAPGQVGQVVNTIVDATDQPDDPANWLMELIADEVGGTAGSLINGSRPFIAGYLNDRLLQWAPDLVDTMLALGNDFGQLSRNFGTNETLEITGANGSYMSTHTITGAHFNIDGMESDHAFSAYSMADIAVPGVGISLADDGKFEIAQHMVPLTYGKILRIGVDEVLIPMLDPSAQNLAQLLQHQVDCVTVGYFIQDAVYSATGFNIGYSVGQAGCNAALIAAANKIYQQVEGIDANALELGLAGTARARDTDNDRKVDTIQTGTWAGNASYAGTPAPLTGATFYGSRQ